MKEQKKPHTSKKITIPRLLAILTGMLIVVVSDINLVVLGISYFLLGSIFGYVWFLPSWRWGFWITSPMIFIIGLSVVFAGYLDVFVREDLPILLLAVGAACMGSFAGSLVRYKQRPE